MYALPADGKENNRLEKQHQLMMHLFGGPVVAPIRDRLQFEGMRVLDVGCGPGSWIRVRWDGYLPLSD
jgi:2-polyprenyl-3-methyl-5-hydroxy-6-metoxy-1,4-benzoquinol methylase